MPTPAAIIDNVAALMNDSVQDSYTDAACLPYFNMALQELQEIFELNNIPVTNKVSSVLSVAAGVSTLAFVGTTPLIPTDLIEIYEIWESPSGLNQWSEMKKLDFIPLYLVTGDTISQFLIWAWVSNEIKLIAANADIDLKLEYIASIFSPVAIGAINTDLGVQYKNIVSYLQYATAALCSMFIGENETRAVALASKASSSIERSLGISTKGRQSIVTKRQPFRAGYKRRNSI